MIVTKDTQTETQDKIKLTPEGVIEFYSSISGLAELRDIVFKLEKEENPENEKGIKALKQVISVLENPPPELPGLPEQKELFPSFRPSKIVNVNKDVVISFVSTKKIREKFPNLLNLKLAGDDKTLTELLDEIENWYRDLKGADFANWIKVFLFARAVKDKKINEPDTIDLYEEQDGRLRFYINTDKRFYEFFEEPTGTKPNGTKYYTDKQKKKIIAWLEKNNGVIEFPVILPLPNNKKAIIPKARKVFEFKSGLTEDGKQILIFYIDTSILDDEFKNYVSFKRADIDAIETAWKKETPKYEDISLSSYSDIPLRFFTRLKLLYSREALKTLDHGFIACVQTLSKENLDNDLGCLSERIQKTLKSRDRIRTGKTSNKPQEIKKQILETTFKIAIELKWLLCMPSFNNGIYKFTMIPTSFDKQEAIKRITEAGNG